MDLRKGINLTMDLTTIAAGVSAVVMAVVAYRALTRPPPLYGEREDLVVEGWESYAADGHWMGAEEPAVTLLEFGDYECPACRDLHVILDELLTAYPDAFAVSYRHWPLPYHRYAYPAARAAECAADQGAFEEFHRHLYTSDNWLGDAFLRFGENAGVADLATFEECISSTEPVARIEADMEAAAEIGGRGTPTVVLNGLLLGAVPTEAQLRRAIEGAQQERPAR